VLRTIFGTKRDEVAGEWSKLHNEELNVLYCSPTIVRVIKLRRMRWAGHVARAGGWRGVYRVLVGKAEGKRVILTLVFRKWDVGVWTGLGWLRIETGGGQLCPKF
jgi:hypothetical protein